MSKQQIVMITRLWTVMAEMYGPSWKTSHGPIQNSSGEFTDRFILWATETKNLTKEQWERAFNLLNDRIKKNVHENKNNFPPTIREFLAATQKPVGSAAHNPFPPKQIPDETAKAKAREAGEKTLERLNGLFD